MSALGLYWLFLRAVLLSFSGFATVPMIRDVLVLHGGLLTDAQLNDAIAISQASPGPLGLYIVVVGYFVAGMPGALSGALALASPALLAIPLARMLAFGASGGWQGACRGIVIAACLLMMATGVRLVPAAAPSATYVVLILTGVVALALTTIKPVWVVLVAAVVGLVVG